MRHLLALIIAISLLITAGLTNPSEVDHQAAVAKSFNQENPVAGFFGTGKVLAEFIAYNDYGLFSTTSLEGRGTSLGVFGLVYPSPPKYDELQKIVLNRLPKHLREKLPRPLQRHLPDTTSPPGSKDHR